MVPKVLASVDANNETFSETLISQLRWKPCCLHRSFISRTIHVRLLCPCVSPGVRNNFWAYTVPRSAVPHRIVWLCSTGLAVLGSPTYFKVVDRGGLIRNSIPWYCTVPLSLLRRCPNYNVRTLSEVHKPNSICVHGLAVTVVSWGPCNSLASVGTEELKRAQRSYSGSCTFGRGCTLWSRFAKWD